MVQFALVDITIFCITTTIKSLNEISVGVVNITPSYHIPVIPGSVISHVRRVINVTRLALLS